MSLTNITHSKKLVKEILEHAKMQTLDSYKQIEEGIMNTVLDVQLTTGEEVIIKLSDQPKKYSIEKEAFVINIVKEHGVPVAPVLWSDFSKEYWPFEVMIMKKLQGNPAQQVWNDLTKKQQEYVAKQAGHIFSILHQITFEKPARITGSKIQPFPNYYTYLNTWKPRDIQTAKDMGFIPKELIDTINTQINKHESLFRAYTEFSLCHMDYHLGHIFIDETGYITGIIDWGFAEIGPRESDFFKPHRWIFDKGEHTQKAFLKGYTLTHNIPAQLEEKIRLYRIIFDFKFIERLLKTDQEYLAGIYVTKLKEHLGVLEHSKSLI